MKTSLKQRIKFVEHLQRKLKPRMLSICQLRISWPLVWLVKAVSSCRSKMIHYPDS